LQAREWAFSILRMVRFPKLPFPVKQVNPFCEVRRSPIHGMGVFASRHIRKGTRIIEYVGELIDKDESNRRGLELFEQSKKTGGAAVYIFELNETHDLDGDKSYNDARLINHSCDPNAEMVNEDNHLWLFALRDILPGEEITFDYGYDIEHFMDHPCRCGTSKCVGFIVSQAQWPKLKRALRKRSGKKNTKLA
jgi:SET domain-containing protein